MACLLYAFLSCTKFKRFQTYNHSFRYAQGTKRYETVGFVRNFVYNVFTTMTDNYKSRGGECAVLLGLTAYLYV